MTDRELVKQKLKVGAESICSKCFHGRVCRARDNQPCVECNQFVDANGVIVPPCKVGDAIYKLLDNETVVGGWSVFSITVYKSVFVITDDCGFQYANDEIGKEIFLTKEEAEKALKEREGNG